MNNRLDFLDKNKKLQASQFIIKPCSYRDLMTDMKDNGPILLHSYLSLLKTRQTLTPQTKPPAPENNS